MRCSVGSGIGPTIFSGRHNPLFLGQALLGNSQHPVSQQYAWAVMLLAAMPFLFLGICLTLRRLRTINLSVIWCLVFFIPFLNVAFFLLFALFSAPQAETKSQDLKEKNEVAAHRSSGTLNHMLISIIILAAVGFGLTILGVRTKQYWGYSLFVGMPFAMGFLTILLANRRMPVAKYRVPILACAPVLFSLLVLVLCAIEGVGCVLMAVPFAVLLSVTGGIFADILSRNSPSANQRSSLQCLTVLPLAMLVDLSQAQNQIQAPANKVHSTIEIHANVNTVSFPPIKTANHGVFSFYVPKLEKAVIDGSGIGAIRRCIFDQGTFVEPITVWRPGHELSFSVRSQINRFTPYLTTTQGQFKLIRLGPNRTKLIGNTWYKMHVAPKEYWQIWANYFIHGIHMRALDHIKHIAESKSL